MINRLIKIIACCLAFIFFSTVVYAGVTPVTFRQQGSRYLYSNNPEPINAEMVNGAAYGQYSIEQQLAKYTSYNCEFTHGNRSYSNVYLGIVLRNNNSSPQKIRVISEQLGYTQSGLDTFSSITLKYQIGREDKLERIIKIPAKSTVVLMGANIPHDRYVTGKINFITSNGPLVTRVFWIRADKFKIPSQAFSLPRAKAEPNPNNSPWARGSGFYWFDGRSATIDEKVIQTVYLGGLYENPGEYEKGSNVSGNPIIPGNYGITYDFILKNAQGKKVKITPNLADKKAQVVLWESKKGWYKTTLITDVSPVKYWLIDVPPDGRLKFVLPSFNCGNTRFDFVDSR
ncbi:MAG: hypothetical protein ACYC21_15450 [Eubacteriales bacterium]